MTDPQVLAEAVLRGEHRSAARLITAIEQGRGGLRPALERLEKESVAPRLIGLTGPPGAGKSTLADALIAGWRAMGRTVAVLAVDPSSPFGGGAVLGDRIRMQRHGTDRGVFLRSMSARGAAGGLARAAGDALTVLGALGVDIVLVETVGVGQTEVDIARFCACVVLLQTPAGGDIVQAIKAGVIEIGDIHAIGKPKAGDAPRMQQALREALALSTRDRGGWSPPVLIADARTGEGIGDLMSAIDARFDWLADRPAVADDAARDRLAARAQALALDRCRDALAALDRGGPELSALADAVMRQEASTGDLALAYLRQALGSMSGD